MKIEEIISKPGGFFSKPTARINIKDLTLKDAEEFYSNVTCFTARSNGWRFECSFKGYDVNGREVTLQYAFCNHEEIMNFAAGFRLAMRLQGIEVCRRSGNWLEIP